MFFLQSFFSFKLIFKAFSCLFVLYELWHRELWFIRLKQPVIRLVGFLITVCSYFFVSWLFNSAIHHWL